jgi:hypothetical protein
VRTPLAANTIVAGEEWGTAIVRYHCVGNFFLELIDVCFWTKADNSTDGDDRYVMGARVTVGRDGLPSGAQTIIVRPVRVARGAGWEQRGVEAAVIF